MTPAFPLFCLHKVKEPYVYLVEEAQDLSHYTLAGYYNSQRHPELYFDATGRKFGCKLKLKRSFGKWQKLVSYFYWGRISVESHWYSIGLYSLAELKEQVALCIVADDDILTQFIEAEHLLSLVEQARHFEDLYMVLSGAIYNSEDDDSIEI
ncbi:hypothetical protein [Hymenobacter rubripertinctus]|uniref:Uncharacterized protein n=1 Tax=Hymenobacter rubripertinctus TaxID=2029981 RepID=A0A418R604_9BACT|nr:hypothetical protein [Hymenobacter rubripertinctus]RIY12883.1 hypothetical protein D0T11_03925 [Hymenobacter rubripertinctus]